MVNFKKEDAIGRYIIVDAIFFSLDGKERLWNEVATIIHFTLTQFVPSFALSFFLFILHAFNFLHTNTSTLLRFSFFDDIYIRAIDKSCMYAAIRCIRVYTTSLHNVISTVAVVHVLIHREQQHENVKFAPTC